MVVSREVRRNPLTGDEVVLSSDRVVEQRPAPAAESGACPFCPGNEAHTRPTIAAVEREGRWVARAFANRMPALVVEEVLEDRGRGLLQAVSGVGAHEVLVEAPEHAPLHRLPVERAADALALAVDRLRDLRRDQRLATLQWFRNHGAGAGASQAHPHAQIVGLPVVPRRVAALVQRAHEHLERTGRRLLRNVLDAEHADGRRILFRDGPITALCPFAPRHPFEVWLVPEDPGPGFADATDDERSALARASRRIASALAIGLGENPHHHDRPRSPRAPGTGARRLARADRAQIDHRRGSGGGDGGGRPQRVPRGRSASPQKFGRERLIGLSLRARQGLGASCSRSCCWR